MPQATGVNLCLSDSPDFVEHLQCVMHIIRVILIVENVNCGL